MNCAPGVPRAAAPRLSEDDYGAAADALPCEVAALKAVAEIESAGDGFGPEGRPKVLFEAHHFYRYTQGRYAQSHPTLCTKAWNPKLYAKTQDGEWARVEAAKTLDARAALLSTSWGKFQIMGFNHVACGFGSVEQFVAMMQTGEPAQLGAFLAFLKHRKLDAPLREHRWADFARGYNGPRYLENRYDAKLRSAYLRHGGTL